MKILKEFTIDSNTVNNKVGVIIGMVIFLYIVDALAPSIFAASYTSLSIVVSAAVRSIIITPIYFHCYKAYIYY